MTATKAKQVDLIGVDRGRRLVVLAFSPESQRFRSAGAEQPLAIRTIEIKMKVTKENGEKEIVSAGGFNPNRCHAPSRRPPKYSDPITGTAESVREIMRGIRSLPVLYQLWLNLHYRETHDVNIEKKIHQLLCALYRREHIKVPVRAGTLNIISRMMTDHLLYLRGTDVPPDSPMSRSDAGTTIRDIKGEAWKQTYSKYWRSTYQAVLAVDEHALIRIDAMI